jgi:hypothetical protein
MATATAVFGPLVKEMAEAAASGMGKATLSVAVSVVMKHGLQSF